MKPLASVARPVPAAGFLAQGEPRGSILRIVRRKLGSCAPQQLLKTLWIDAVGLHQGFNDRIRKRLGHVAREPGPCGRSGLLGRTVEGSFRTLDAGFGLLEIHDNLLQTSGAGKPVRASPTMLLTGYTRSGIG